MIRLIITPLENRGTYSVALESTGEPLVDCTRSPLRDGAAELLARGHDPFRPMTMRAINSSRDLYAAGPIADFAGSVDRHLRAPGVLYPHEEQGA